MAIPTSDPQAIPKISTLFQPGGGYVKDGHAYTYYITGEHLSIFLKAAAAWDSSDPPVPLDFDTYDHADILYFPFDPTDFYFKDSFYMQASSPAGVQIWQPLAYEHMTVPAIAYSFARWKAGIDPSDIDLSAFSAVDTFCLANGRTFCVVFFEESALATIRDICEASGMLFLYINGAGKIACGYLENEPSAADWELPEVEILSVKSYGKMLDRTRPKLVKYGWDGRNIPNGSPRFGWAQVDLASPVGSAKAEQYESKWVEGLASWPGEFVDFGLFVKLEVEVGPSAFRWDLDEAVKVSHRALGLSLDPFFPDLFRVHKIVYHFDSMTASVTLIKKTWWNAS